MAKQPEYSWGSYLMPWEIAWNGQRWVDEHLTMQDVLEGFRCMNNPDFTVAEGKASVGLQVSEHTRSPRLQTSNQL